MKLLRSWVALAVLLFVLARGAFAQTSEDRVTLLSDSGAAKITVRGTVTDWNGKTLSIRSGDGVRHFPAERVLEVSSAKLPSHQAAEQAFVTNDFDRAHEQFTAALAEEPRQWMRRELLAELVRTALARGDREAAGTAFISLLDSDRDTRYFDLIPLLWPPEETVDSASATLWLESDREATRLLAASWLLFDKNQGKTAAATLDRLAVSLDRRIYPIARAQLWRRVLAERVPAAGEIDFWESRLDDMPESLRGGPRYLLGLAWERQDNAERAAAAFLWLPLVYATDHSLAADAELRAARQLARIGRSADAVVLYREILDRFAKTPSAPIAKQSLDALATPQPATASP